ncbi:unnamed protein product [Penicillium salamii]|nr:unnamed protein product [Penicillium salamii]CAG8163585.1 unnamed protein product [Penicillium salamii]CAG8429461.1 unnamed protein product [Penicillium salamii]
MAPLNNNGHGPLQVPGFNSIPLEFQLPLEARFAHGLIGFRHPHRLTKREMAMLRLMLHITEQPEWDRAILDPDEARLAQWYQDAKEGTEGFLISPATWDWCLAELRDKAETWQRTGHLLVFDSSSALCQADLSKLVGELQTEIARLGSQQDHDSPLVDPSLYPLVYDRSYVLVQGGDVSLENLWKLPGQVAKDLPIRRPFSRITPGLEESRYIQWSEYESCWSSRFQWLPCEVQFEPEPLNDISVRIKSYVNNLHPWHQKGLYTQLERLIGSAVPSWNDILFYGNTRGRRAPRILTYGCEVHNQNEDHQVFDLVHRWLTWNVQCATYEEWQERCDIAREYLAGPEPPRWKQACMSYGARWEDMTQAMWDIPKHVKIAINAKRRRKAWFDHPEPGVSFSYEQWRKGQCTGSAIHPQRLGKHPDPQDHHHVPVRLEQQFRQEGLQVVVEITRIDLTPENPVYSGESHFHVEGLRNDHIVATSLYAVECKNVTQARVAFQHEDRIDSDELDCKVPEALSLVLDVGAWANYEEPPDALHTFGSVGTTEGHLLSWPNTYRSKLESFQLRDTSQSGHMTLVKLRLVDPHYRVCSTRNVPPQQHEWWAAAAEQASNLDKRLPRELILSVMNQTDCWPMSDLEARHLREEFHGDHERARTAIDKCVWFNNALILDGQDW